MKLSRCLLASLVVAALTGCQDDKSDIPAGARAGGEILERSIDDDMIHYDTIRSQGPLASPSDAASDTSDGGAATPDAE